MPLSKRTVDTGQATEASLSFRRARARGSWRLSTAGEIPQAPPEVQNSSQDRVFLPNKPTFFLPGGTEQKGGLGCCPRIRSFSREGISVLTHDHEHGHRDCPNPPALAAAASHRNTPRVFFPTGPVKPPPSGSGLPDRFDRKSVETG